MARPRSNSLSLPWNLDDPCPCSSGQNYKDCCLQPDGLPLWSLPSLGPPGASTGASHPKCYLNSTTNCSTKLSREHYISKNILLQFERLKASGFPWQAPDEDLEYRPDALTSKVLCTRHNSSLSPLDTAAGHAFRQITDAMIYVTRNSLSRRPAFFLASGDALELWGIKTLLGFFAAKIARSEGTVLADHFVLDYDTACRALSGFGLKQPLGMYVHHEGGKVIHGIGVSPLTSPRDNTVAGLRVSMLGVQFDFILDRRGGNPQFFEERKFFRPWVLDLNGPRRTARIILTWASQRKTAVRVSVDIKK